MICEGFLKERTLEQGPRPEATGWSITEGRSLWARRLSKLMVTVLETLRFCDWTRFTMCDSDPVFCRFKTVKVQKFKTRF